MDGYTTQSSFIYDVLKIKALASPAPGCQVKAEISRGSSCILLSSPKDVHITHVSSEQPLF